MKHDSTRPRKSLVAREYLRVSKDRHGLGKSPDQQHHDNEQAISARGWSMHPRPYRDDNRSASRYARRDREAFAQLITDLEHDAFDADILVIWESSRGSRRTGEWVNLIELCEMRKVRIFVTTHARDYDPTNARDRRSMLEDAVDSEYESAKTSERLRRSTRAAAERGQVHGKNLYGYQRIYDQQSRQLVRIEEHPEQAAIVREAAAAILDGASLYSVAKSLNERGIPPRRPARVPQRAQQGWTPTAVKQMLCQPAYAGLRQHQGAIVAQGQWPALIDPQQWEHELRPLLNNPTRRRTNDSAARHLLSGIAVCHICEAPLRVFRQKERATAIDASDDAASRPRYLAYVCPGTPGKSSFHVAMKAEHLDLIVTQLLLARLTRPDFLATIGQQDHTIDAQRHELLQQINRHQEYLLEVHAHAAERQDFSIYTTQEALITPKLDQARHELQQLTAADPAVFSLAGSQDITEAWSQRSLTDQRRILRAVMRPRVKRTTSRGARGLDFERVIPGWL